MKEAGRGLSETGGGRWVPTTQLLTQADHDIIKTFLSTVPAGFPLSPGAALAELTGLPPLSPGVASSGHYSPSRPGHYSPSRPGLYSPSRSGQQSPYRPNYFSPSRPTPHSPSRTSLHSPSRTSHLSPSRTLEIPADHQIKLTRPRAIGNSQRGLGSTYNTQLPVEPQTLFLDSPHYLTLSHSPHQSPARRLNDAREKRSLEMHHCTSQDSLKKLKVGNLSPDQQPEPQHSTEHNVLQSDSFSSSPRRPNLNPPNSYSPVDPPSPFSPRRLALSSPHGLDGYDETQPKREMDKNPSQSETLVGVKHRNLTQSINKKLEENKKSRKRVNNGFSSKQRLKVEKEKLCTSIKTNSTLSEGHFTTRSDHQENKVSKVELKPKEGCGCKINCLEELDPEFICKHRCNIEELSKGEHDMYLMGIMMASLANPKSTTKHQERQRNRNKYIFQGKEVCQEAFIYLENVTIYQLKSIRKHVLENGVIPRTHHNKGKRPHNLLESKHYHQAEQFVKDLLEQHKSLLSITTDTNLRELHDKYKQYFRVAKDDLPVMAYSTFRKFVHEKGASQSKNIRKDKSIHQDHKGEEEISDFKEMRKNHAKPNAQTNKSIHDHTRICPSDQTTSLNLSKDKGIEKTVQSDRLTNQPLPRKK